VGFSAVLKEFCGGVEGHSNRPEHRKMLRPVDRLSREMKKGAYLMASMKPTNRRLKDRMKF